MGKKLHNHHHHHQESLGKQRTGCMWGAIIHHLHHKKWHRVRLSQTTHNSSAGKHPSDEGSTRIPSEPPEMQENNNDRAKPMERPKTGSMKSRIKALIAERMPKRRGLGRHSGSPSCPVKTPPDNETPVVVRHSEFSDNTMRACQNTLKKREVNAEDLYDDMNAEKCSKSSPEFGNKSPLRSFKRTLSCNSLFDRSCPNLRFQTVGTVLPVIPMGRTRSLPDLTSYVDIKVDDRCLHAPETNDVRKTTLDLKSSSGIDQQLENATDTDALVSEGKPNSDNLVQMQADDRNRSEFDYVKHVLEQSGFIINDSSSTSPGSSLETGTETCDHLLMFDIVNEVLLRVNERSLWQWPRDKACQGFNGRVLEEVLGEIRWLLRSRPEVDKAVDDAAVRWDLEKWDRWMDLQADAEDVALEVEGLIFDELLQEIINSI